MTDSWNHSIRFTVLAVAAVLLGGCAGSSLFPMSVEPDRTELTEWQQETLLKTALAVMPPEAANSIPSSQGRQAARFVARALETAPDGQTRNWQTADRSISLSVRPIATDSSSESICRDYDLKIKLAGATSSFTPRACRTTNGIWRR